MGLGLVSWGPTIALSLLPPVILSLLLRKRVQKSVTFVAGSVLVVVGLGVGWLLGLFDVGTTLTGVMTLAVASSLTLVYRIDGPDGRWGRTVRSRLLMGVPWGTLVVATFVLLVYLFVQGGAGNWRDPVTTPFRAWSYLYPVGIVTSAFSHNGPGHLVGNLVGTLVLGTVAEYAWGHFPSKRGSTSFASRARNPYFRAFLVFPGVVLSVGLVTAVFSMGPVIGFSGVVFALAGFAITRYPITTVVGTVGMGAVQRIYFALQNPSFTAQASPSGPSAPWWSQVAIQGHALGLLVGILLGWFVFRRRSERPSGARLWTGVFLFGMAENLWAVYWFGGNETYILYQGIGIVLVSLLALLVTAALTASDEQLFDGIFRGPKARIGRTIETDGGGDSFPGWLSRRHVAIGLLLLGVSLLAAPGLGLNFVTAASHDAPDDGIEVRDYTVFYAEDVTNEMVNIVDFQLFNQSTRVETSGVIVSNPDRHIWEQEVSKSGLAFRGRVGVDVGGIGWRETVVAERNGWNLVGGNTVYKVWIYRPGEPRRLVFRSPNATSGSTIDGRNVTISPGQDRFEVVVSRNQSVLGAVAIPETNDVARVGGLRILNREGTLLAARNDTIVRVAGKETYD
jgi:membrane associated rhomboid family serine protease